VVILGDEKKSDTEKEQKSGLPQISAMHVIIAVAVIVLAVIFIAKFGFGTDLISPSSGDMAVVKRPVTPVPTLIQNPSVKQSFTIRPEPIPTCASPTKLCGESCTDIKTDPNNCGACDIVCSKLDRKNVAEFGCSNAKCTIKSCQPGYGDCASQGTADINGDGCETNLKDGTSWIYNQYNTNVYLAKDPSQKVYLENPRNCGSCGNACSSPGGNVFGICDNGACRKVCWGEWLDCNNDMTDRCEQVFDENNCGTCGAKCPADTFCNHGCCVLKADQKQVVADSLGVKCSGNTWQRMSK
jgi:hypothetical protein